jgi:hypothetical protein
LYVIESVIVTCNKRVIKKISTGEGGGVPRFMGEEKEKMTRKKGPGTSE